jgi:hypothetical protein
LNVAVVGVALSAFPAAPLPAMAVTEAPAMVIEYTRRPLRDVTKRRPFVKSPEMPAGSATPVAMVEATSVSAVSLTIALLPVSLMYSALVMGSKATSSALRMTVSNTFVTAPVTISIRRILLLPVSAM